MTSVRALVIDPGADSALERAVVSHGFRTASTQTTEGILSRIESEAFEVVIVDLRTAGARELVVAHAERLPEIPIIAVAAEGAEGDGADVLRDGAAEWIRRPLEPKELGHALERALTRGSGGDEKPPSPSVRGWTLLGASPAIERVRELVERAAKDDATVLIRGETGTGKELVARSLHDRSPRHARPFIKTHVAALPDSLLESELFGYEKGAFTGAAAKKPGRVELAEGGTLFLDEIGEISPSVQAKLLRLVQDREYERLGGTRALRADVRFVAATHRDLEHMARENKFREDLFYRLNVVSIWLPPLRARRDDIPLLVREYATRLTELRGRPPVEFDDAAMAVLRGQRWPGNVRQLLNLVERLVVLLPAPVVTAEDVKRELEEQVTFATQSTQGTTPEAPSVAPPAGRAQPTATPGESLLEGAPSTVRPLREELRRAELRALNKALASAGGNRSLAARILGVSRRTLYTKLEEHKLI